MREPANRDCDCRPTGPFSPLRRIRAFGQRSRLRRALSSVRPDREVLSQGEPLDSGAGGDFLEILFGLPTSDILDIAMRRIGHE